MKYFVILSLTILCNNAFAKTTNSTPTFEVKVIGSGEQSILFIPGFASSGAVWNETRTWFDDQFTTYTFTMDGFAGVPPQNNPTFETWRKAIGSFMNTHDLNNAIIIGHSMGGLLAMAIAVNNPKLISKLVVVDTLPFLAALRRPGYNNDCSPMVNRITSMSDAQFRRMQRGTVQRMVADSTKRELVLRWSLQSDRRTFAKMYCEFLNTDLRKEIGKIKSSVLVLLEERLKNFSKAVQKQYKHLSNGTIKYAPRGSHFIMYGAKEWFKKQLTKFIHH